MSSTEHGTESVTENGYAIETEELWRIYKLGGQEIPALRGVNLRIEPGQFISLKGRSGSGKTTLLNCLGGLDQPTKGIVRIFGEEIGGWNERKLTMWRRHQVGFIFQSLGLLPTLSAYENVELILRMTGEKAKIRRQRTMDCLDLVGLTKWADHRPYEMSGGQQQRVAVARALANAPKMIIADEPTGELDSNTGAEILTLFQTVIKEQNVTMLMATHDSLSDDYVDQVLHLRDGQIISAEELAEIERMENEAAEEAHRQADAIELQMATLHDGDDEHDEQKEGSSTEEQAEIEDDKENQADGDTDLASKIASVVEVQPDAINLAESELQVDPEKQSVNGIQLSTEEQTVVLADTNQEKPSKSDSET